MPERLEAFLVSIILLAMVAAFLALRLYSVLGKRTGHEQTFVAPSERSTRPVVTVGEEGAAQPAPGSDSPVEPRATAGVRAIAQAESGFDAERFLAGAKAAYRTVLEAFWRGDADAIAPLADAHVSQTFATAIAERKQAGFTLDNRLVAIEQAVITDAKAENGVAEVTVRFDADIAAVTRDASGKVVAGSLSDAVPSHDSWTFRRELRSPNPNWLLIDTHSA